MKFMYYKQRLWKFCKKAKVSTLSTRYSFLHCWAGLDEAQTKWECRLIWYPLATNFASGVGTYIGIVETFKHLLRATVHPQFWCLSCERPWALARDTMVSYLFINLSWSSLFPSSYTVYTLCELLYPLIGMQIFELQHVSVWMLCFMYFFHKKCGDGPGSLACTFAFNTPDLGDGSMTVGTCCQWTKSKWLIMSKVFTFYPLEEWRKLYIYIYIFFFFFFFFLLVELTSHSQHICL